MYGNSNAAKLNTDGRFDEAIAAATTAITADPRDPEPLVDRAFALAALDRYDEAAADLERALVLDEEASVLETSLVDDQLFSALLGAARRDPGPGGEDGVRRLERYRQVMPDGAHLGDLAEWTKRLRGEVRREIVKERVEE